ncbi:putative membrane protein [Kineococcus radiotolerans]|uniref:Uncharacterized protein n=2 Tax=Kineococcus radiotolerans TaxID=131568 RepID=A6WDS0_KINRD|nr:DUF4233 domain-containing protein [Kineococcus radiotolerans]ABS04959.1 conserved hypothetical protein [Kineococcus radiotolerans SRS30216 = ATCC BAA-149]MBB2901805.1 putative membrane protein [Kineococcus radiotolerans]
MRNPKRMMAATVLISEALVVFFATLTAYGLSETRHVSYLVVGGVLLLLCVLCAGMLRSRAGYAFGWVLQVVMIAGGFVVPMMFLVGAGFAVIWFFAVRLGNRIEREQAEIARRLADGS